ncbi:hypothetical protein KMP13_05735 [Epibacterium ulvae]|uniref:hypothetical protein n=1 Tax=Epibacterium ulvae TaxID=1156985 RepID=UPI001BFC7253|nr:hypothetical protein [Epibacterium ulvae]MBT8153401.1 hypothetical protein [Epibacterium ulvae]
MSKWLVPSAKDNPGHATTTAEDIREEFDDLFSGVEGGRRNLMTSEVLQEIESLVPETHRVATTIIQNGDCITIQVHPVIWLHTADQA